MRRRANTQSVLGVSLAAFSLIVGFAATIWANDFYVIAAGKRAKRTVLVSPQGTAVASGTALLNAVNGITDASATNQYLIFVEPGVYDLGGSSLHMKAFVDIQGSGENATKIEGNISSYSAGVINGADNAELRFVTVESTGATGPAIAIYNASSPKITHVTANAVGGNDAYGIYNEDSTPTLTNVTATASGGTTYNRAVLNQSASPFMTNVTASASGGTDSWGIYSYGSFYKGPTMIDVTASASGASNTNCGIYNSDGSPEMRNVKATASGGAASYGMHIRFHSTPTMTHVIAAAEGAGTNIGVYNDLSSTIRMDHSVLSGSTRTLFTCNSTSYIGNSRLAGGSAAASGTGTNTCAGVYDESYIFYASTCP